MTWIKYINYFFIVPPLITGIRSLFNSTYEFIFISLLIPLGIFQSITGLFLAVQQPRKIQYVIYTLGIILFVILLGFEIRLAFVMPVTLALYFTFVTHTFPNKNQTNEYSHS